MFKPLLAIFAVGLLALNGFAQEKPQQGDSIAFISTAAISNLYSGAEKSKTRLDKKSKKILARFERLQSALIASISKTDSFSANNLQDNASYAFDKLSDKLKCASLDQYIPRLDSISTYLKFLQLNNSWLDQAKDARVKVDQALAKVKGLENSINQAEAIKQFIRERREYLKTQFQKFGFSKRLGRVNKQFFYYSQQFREYKETLNDPKKAERKVLELLSKTKFFQQFMQKNSLLASLFRLPGDPNDPNYVASLNGLQTRVQVNNLIQSQLSVAGPSGSQQFQQSFQQAQAQLNEVKGKIIQSGGSGGDDEIANFRANSQKTKTFWKRLEYSTNVQTQKSNNFFPVTSDLGISAGYKLSDRSTIGIGASYKVGWGNGWKNINLSSQGIGLRSFLDIHLKGAFWISGGYEQNYRSAFESIAQIKDLDAWQKSGLIGLTKTVPIKTKFFKKSKLQLLWDFLSYQQIPRTQPIVFRIGYTFSK